MHGLLAITRLTFLEAHRRWVVWAATLLGVAFLSLFAVGVWLVAREARNAVRVGELFEMADFFLLAGLYAVDFLVVVLAVLVSIDSLPGEIASGTIQTLVTKPIRRWEVVLGKWLGLAAMLGLFAVVMSSATILIVAAIMSYTPRNPVPGIALIGLEGIVVMSLCMLGGTRLTTLANGVVVFMLFGMAFVGGWIEQFGALLGNGTAVNLGIVISLVMPAEALWRRAAYLMEPPAISQLGVHPFAAVSAPSQAMVAYAIAYVAIAMALAVMLFNRRDL